MTSDSPKTFVVTRHEETKAFVKQHGYGSATFIEHLDEKTLKLLSPGDKVVGTLPVHIAAQVNQRGAHYIHFAIDVSHAERGKEQTDLTKLNPRFEPYLVAPGTPLQPAKPETSKRIKKTTGVFAQIDLTLFSIAALLSGSFSTQLVSNFALPEKPGISDPVLFLFGIAFLTIFSLSVYLTMLSSLRLLSIQTTTMQDVIEPKSVLVTGLSAPSADASQALTAGREFLAFVHRRSLTLEQAGANSAAFKDLLASANEPITLDRFNWLTNFVSINAHKAALKKIILVRSSTTPDELVSLFEDIVRALYKNTFGRAADGPTFVNTPGADYFNFDEVFARLSEAVRHAGTPTREICIEVTPGTKQFGICAALATLDNDASFIYVSPDRHLRQIQSRIEFGKASV